MKNILLLFLILGCNSFDSKEIKQTQQKDSSEQYLYAELSAKILNIKLDLSKEKTENQSLLSKVDSLQTDVIKYQNSSLQLGVIKKRLDYFIEKNSLLIEKISDLNKRNSELKDSNISKQSQLAGERIRSNRLSKQNIELKNAFKIKVAAVNINPYGYEKGFLKKGKLIRTNRVKQVTSIEVSFVVVSEPNLKEGTYVIDIFLKGVYGNKGIKKSLIIEYAGKELPCKVVFNEAIDWQVGYHKVEIITDDIILFSGGLNLI